MPINPITPFTGTAPVIGQSQSEFNDNVQDELLFMNGLATEINTFATEANALASEVNADKIGASASAAAAAASAGSVVTGNKVHVGNNAGATNQGAYLVAVGAYTCQTNGGESSAAVGAYAGNSNMGAYSFAAGWGAGENGMGGNSVAVGQRSGQTNMGDSSVAVGQRSGYTNMGDNSVAVGPYAGYTNMGDNSVAVGPYAGYTSQPSNSIAINSDTNNNTPVTTKQIQIGRGDYGVKIGDGNVQAVSDRRDKYDITDSPIGLDFINDLTPCFYKYDIRELYEETIEIKGDEDNVTGYETIKHKPDGSKAGKRNHAGLIAQDVKTVMDKHGVDFGLFRDESIGAEDAHKDRASDKLALCYIELVPVLIKSVQELSARVIELESK